MTIVSQWFPFTDGAVSVVGDVQVWRFPHVSISGRRDGKSHNGRLGNWDGRLCLSPGCASIHPWRA